GAVAAVTGEVLDGPALGAGARRAVASLVADDEDDALALVADVIAHLPPNVAELPPVLPATDPPDRACHAAAAAVPAEAATPYDVRRVLADVVDHGEVLEL